MSGQEFSRKEDLLSGLPQRLRKRQTAAEEMLWRVLRNRRFRDLKFRRQHRITNYVADFYCHKLKLVLELDGGVHASPRQKDHDENRDTFLEYLGCRVVRVPNDEIFQDLGSVLRKLNGVVDELMPTAGGGSR